MARALLPFAVLLLLVGVGAWFLATRSDDGPSAIQPLSARDASRRYPVLRMPPERVAYAQEIWISHKLAPGQDLPGWRTGRTREEALEMARGLYQQVLDGADLGTLARQTSNAPGGRARGFAFLAGIHDPPDSRDRVFLNTPPGQLTPLVEWNAGFWFARRVTAAEGEQLRALFEAETRRRAKARAIVFGHQDARPHRADFDKVTRAAALYAAQQVLARIQAGEDFDKVARETGNDASKERGGLLFATHPRPGEEPFWLHWGDEGYPADMMDVILYTGDVGRVHPEVLDTARGTVVLEILEREGDT